MQLMAAASGALSIRRWPQIAVVAGWMLVAGSLARAEAPVLDVEGMTFTATRHGVNELVLRADTARFETGAQTAHLQGVQVEMADDEEREGFRMRCERGDLDLASNDFYAEGEVIGRTEAGREFNAPWVRYVHEQGLLFTDAPVLITEANGTVYRGGGFRYFVRERRFRLLGGASVVQEEQ